MGERPKGRGVKKEGYSSSRNTFDGIYIAWDNIQVFSHIFLQQLYLLEKYRYYKTKDKKYELSKKDKKERQYIIDRAHQLYYIMCTLRGTIKNAYINNPEAKRLIDEKCAKDPCFWIDAFAVTNDPRIVMLENSKGEGLPSKIPLILYPSQRELVEKAHTCFKDRTRLMVEKSRAEGATEVLCAFTVWLFIYGQSGTTQGWVSNKLDAVHLNNDPDSIFMRLFRNISRLPKNMIPGFTAKDHFFNMRLINPNNNNVIKGAGGKDPGRGGRATIYYVDEYAFLENPKGVDAALGDNATTDVYISTPNGRNQFYMEKISERRVVHTMAWFRNPAKCPDIDMKIDLSSDKWKNEDFGSYWLLRNKIEKDALVLRQEILIDYDCYAEEPVIKVEWIKAAIKLGKMDFPKLRTCSPNVAGFDVATGVADRNAYVFREGRHFHKPYVMEGVLSPTHGAQKAQKRARKDGAATIYYDENAYGTDISYNMVMESKEENGFDERGEKVEKEHDKFGIRWVGRKGQRSAPAIKVDSKELASEKYENYRAFSWYMTAKRFEKTFDFVERGDKNVEMKDLISMEDNEDLVAELSTPRAIRDGKKLSVEKKIHIKKRNSNKSTDLGDAFILADDEEYDEELLIDGFDLSNPEIVHDFKVDFNACITPYGSMLLDDRGEVHVMVGLYYHNSRKFKIIYSKNFQRSMVRDIAKDLKSTLRFVNIETWYGDDNILKTSNEGFGSLWSEFAQYEIYITSDLYRDNHSKIEMVNVLFKEKRLIIHEKCRALVENLSGLTANHDGSFPENSYADLLLLLVSSSSGMLFNNEYA
jgi:hypothetical protein